MPVSTTICGYGPKQLKPAPFVSIQREDFRAGQTEQIIGVNWLVTLNGTIVPEGSGGGVLTNTSGALGVFKEKNEIFKAFGTQNDEFVAYISGADCTGYMISGFPYVRSLSMDDSTDNFTQTAGYTVELLFASSTAGFQDILSGVYNLQSVGTSFSVSYEKMGFAYAGESQGGLETLTRTVSAQGLNYLNSCDDGNGCRPGNDPLVSAAAYVAEYAQGCPENASGIGFASAIDHDGIFQRKDRVPDGIFATGDGIHCFLSNRTQDWDTKEGTFSQTDTFLRMSAGLEFNASGFKVRDEYSYDCSFDWSAGGQNTLTVNGTVQGFASYTPTGLLSGIQSSAADQAEGYYLISQTGRIANIQGKAEEIAASKGSGVHPACGYILQGANWSTNAAEGTVTYSETYITDAPFNPDVLSESVNVTRANPSQVYAEQQVLGRSAGPILQDIGTQTATTEELSIEAVVSAPSGTSGLMESDGAFKGAPNYSALVASHLGSISGSDISIYKTNDSESFDLKTGRYTRNVGYIYTDCPS